jgi:hypothetical protein
MPQICHLHCPGDGLGVSGLIIGAGVLTAGGVAISAVIDEIVITAAVVVSVLLVVSIWYLVHVLRRDRFALSRRHEIREISDRVGAISAIPAAPVRKAIPVAHVITDAREVTQTVPASYGTAER